MLLVPCVAILNLNIVLARWMCQLLLTRPLQRLTCLELHLFLARGFRSIISITAVIGSNGTGISHVSIPSRLCLRYLCLLCFVSLRSANALTKSVTGFCGTPLDCFAYSNRFRLV